MCCRRRRAVPRSPASSRWSCGLRWSPAGAASPTCCHRHEAPMKELAALALPFCRWCNGSFFGHVIRDSAWLFPFVEVFHLLALGLLGGILVMVNMSLFGVR